MYGGDVSVNELVQKGNVSILHVKHLHTECFSFNPLIDANTPLVPVQLALCADVLCGCM